MIYRTLAFAALFIFYLIYAVNRLFIRKGRLKNNPDGKEKRHSESGIEFVIRAYSLIVLGTELIAMVAGRSYLPIMGKVIGLYLVLAGIIPFFLDVFVRIRNCRKAGKYTDGPTYNGIYEFSRQPKILGLILTYIGICLMYCQTYLIVISAVGILLLHIKSMRIEKRFEEGYPEYKDYKASVSRYFGFRKKPFCDVRMILYLALLLWSVFYYVTIILYTNIFLSWSFIWYLIGGFALVRFIMLQREIRGRMKKRLPKALRIIYYVLFTAGLSFFLFVEANVFINMNAEPKKNLDYVIILGAGVTGNTPSIPLRARINEAYDYAVANPDTILVPSGGQGFGENISEAECIKNELVQRGISSDRFILEDKSTSTIENLKFSKEKIDSPDSSVGIITNSFHEYRAMLIAKKEGYTNVYSVPGKTMLPVGIHYCVREFFGLVRFYFSDII